MQLYPLLSLFVISLRTFFDVVGRAIGFDVLKLLYLISGNNLTHSEYTRRSCNVAMRISILKPGEIRQLARDHCVSHPVLHRHWAG